MRTMLVCLWVLAAQYCCRAQGEIAVQSSADVRPVVEVEEDVYSWEPADNGAAPMWCYGCTCLVRIGQDVFAGGLQTLKDYPPLLNVRWLLFKREADGWKLQQADLENRTREPCPLAMFPGGPLFMSVNPTLTTDPEAVRGPARPEILQFDPADPKQAYETLLPVWDGEPAFTEHSYRTFAADGPGRSLALLQNIGYTHSEWAFLDEEGAWHSGQLRWPRREDSTYAPYGSTHARCNYPDVFIRDRAVHLCGAAAYNTWDRVKDNEELMGRQWGARWRRLLYTWTEDITQEPFRQFVEIANTFDTGGWLFPGDLWVAPDGAAHIVWFEHPVHWKLRQQHFPDMKRVLHLKHAIVREGRITHRATLVEDGGDVSNEIPGGRGQPRLHVTADGRLFALYYVRGKDEQGEPVSENRMMELYPDGTHGPAIRIPLQRPLTEFFTATPRGGCEPSDVIDMLGTVAGVQNTMGYARIRIQ